MEHESEDDELMTPGDPDAERYFVELEQEGYVRRVDWTKPDYSGQVSPVYERVPPGQRMDAILAVLERDGLIVRNGESRNGQPVYVAACFAPPRSAC